jgi:hypothetical protein
LVGAQTRIAIPLNYNETNVAYEILPFSDADRDGNLEECFEKIILYLYGETIIADILALDIRLQVH